MRGFVETETFHVGPRQDAAALPGQVGPVKDAGESHVLRLRRRLQALAEVAQGEADPGDHHGPGLHAAYAVDPLLEREPLQEVVDPDGLRLLDLAFEADVPGPGGEGARVGARVPLVRAELV